MRLGPGGHSLAAVPPAARTSSSSAISTPSHSRGLRTRPLRMGRPMTVLTHHPAVTGADSVELRVARTLFLENIQHSFVKRCSALEAPNGPPTRTGLTSPNPQIAPHAGGSSVPHGSVPPCLGAGLSTVFGGIRRQAPPEAPARRAGWQGQPLQRPEPPYRAQGAGHHQSAAQARLDEGGTAVERAMLLWTQGCGPERDCRSSNP